MRRHVRDYSGKCLWNAIEDFWTGRISAARAFASAAANPAGKLRCGTDSGADLLRVGVDVRNGHKASQPIPAQSGQTGQSPSAAETRIRNRPEFTRRPAPDFLFQPLKAVRENGEEGVVRVVERANATHVDGGFALFAHMVRCELDAAGSVVLPLARAGLPALKFVFPVRPAVKTP